MPDGFSNCPGGHCHAVALVLKSREVVSMMYELAISVGVIKSPSKSPRLAAIPSVTHVQCFIVRCLRRIRIGISLRVRGMRPMRPDHDVPEEVPRGLAGIAMNAPTRPVEEPMHQVRGSQYQ